MRRWARSPRPRSAIARRRRTRASGRVPPRAAPVPSCRAGVQPDPRRARGQVRAPVGRRGDDRPRRSPLGARAQQAEDPGGPRAAGRRAGPGPRLGQRDAHRDRRHRRGHRPGATWRGGPPGGRGAQGGHRRGGRHAAGLSGRDGAGRRGAPAAGAPASSSSSPSRPCGRCCTRAGWSWPSAARWWRASGGSRWCCSWATWAGVDDRAVSPAGPGALTRRRGALAAPSRRRTAGRAQATTSAMRRSRSSSEANR